MLSEQILIFFQIVFIDLVLAGDNAIIIGMVASKFPVEQRKKIIFWGIGGAVILRIILTLLTLLTLCQKTHVPKHMWQRNYGQYLT